MLFYKSSLAILLLSTLNLVSANGEDNDTIDELSSPCLEFAQTCVDLCMEKENVKSFSSSCAVKASSCKCDGEELASKVFKSLVELYDNIDSDEMKLQVEEKDANVVPMRMLNLVLEDDVNYDEMGQEDDLASEIPKLDYSDILEEIRQNEHLPAEENDESQQLDNKESDYNDAMYLEYDDMSDELDEEAVNGQAVAKNGPELEAGAFCPVFLKRCQDDCPAAPTRSICEVPVSEPGYLLGCYCNGVDISSSVRNQVMAEVFHGSA